MKKNSSPLTLRLRSPHHLSRQFPLRTCSRSSNLGLALKGPLVLLVLVGIAITTIAYLFGEVVPPGSMGLRQYMLGPFQGFVPTALRPGYHWCIPFYSRVHVLPGLVRVVEMHREESSTAHQTAALEIQTIDGATVDVDISVLNRIFFDRGEVPALDGTDGKLTHGGPAELINQVGLAPTTWDQRIENVANDELRRALGRLSTADFYNPHKRDDEVREAFIHIRKRLAPLGIGVEAVLLRRYTYRSERINDAIFQKNLQDVEEKLNATRSKFSEAKAALEQVAARLDAEIETLRIEGDNKSRVLRSEGDLLENQKRASGDLLVAKAHAEVDRLRAGALAQVKSADLLVARELAPLLGTLKGGIVSGIDPYDIEAWMKKFGAVEGRHP